MTILTFEYQLQISGVPRRQRGARPQTQNDAKSQMVFVIIGEFKLDP